MKRKLFLVCLFLTSIVATKAQNLIPNGDFKNGTTGWTLGEFTLDKSNPSYPYIGTSSVSEYDAPAVSQSGLNITDVGGKTYIFSFWGSDSFDEGQIRGFVGLKDKNGYNTGGQLRYLDYKKKESKNGWSKFEFEVTFPKEAYKIISFRMNFSYGESSSGYKIFSYKKIAEISMVEKKVAQPIQNVQVTDKFQREALVVWDTASGVTSYTVQVGTMSETVEGSKYLVKGLEPGSTTTITVSAEGFAPTEVVAETVSITTAEADRIPYVKFNDGVAATSFYPHIYDSTNAPTEVKVFLDGAEVAVGLDGYYTLTVGEGKKLKVTFKDGEQAYELMYIVNVQ